MSETVERAIEKLAQECWDAIRTHNNEVNDVRDVLNAKLRPILELGQRFAEEIDDDIRAEHGGTSDYVGEWNAVLAALTK